MRPEDLKAVDEIAQIVHPDYPEDPEVFADRLQIFPEGCLVAYLADQPDKLVGYTFAHPGVQLQPPPLNCILGKIPEGADCLYLHDVALLPAVRGLGLGRGLVQRLHDLARRFALGPLALTAVNASVRYWHGHGFEMIDPPPALAEKLKSYDDDAAYMIAVPPGAGVGR